MTESTDDRPAGLTQRTISARAAIDAIAEIASLHPIPPGWHEAVKRSLYRLADEHDAAGRDQLRDALTAWRADKSRK